MWQFKPDTVVTWSYQEGDEFNGDKVNTDYWKFLTGPAHTIYTNKEQQYYSIGKNHIVSDGSLKLIAKKEPSLRLTFDGRKPTDSIIERGRFYGLNERLFTYTSGQIETVKPFYSGYFECRLKFSDIKGFWPAFWLHGGDPNEEIDMLESKTERPKHLHIDVHCPNRCDLVQLMFQKRSFGGWVKTKKDFTKEFNIVACDWDKEYVRFYLNGELIGVSDAKLHLEKFLTLNLAVPADDGPFKPGPDKNNTNDCVFEIDYVRVWQKEQNLPRKISREENGFTQLDTALKIVDSKQSKSKGKLLFSEKTRQDDVFISCYHNSKNIQLTCLGVFQKSVPSIEIRDSNNMLVYQKTLGRQINTIEKDLFRTGEYVLIVNYLGKDVSMSFVK